MSYDAFISYAHADSPLALELKTELTAAGLSSWLDTAPLEVEPGREERLVPAGSRHADVIADAIARSAAVVCIDTPAWQASPYCRNEHHQSAERGKRIVAFHPPGASDFGPGARDAPESAVDADSFDQVIAAIRKGLSVGHAHARLLTDKVPASGRRRGFSADARADAALLSTADLGDLGMKLPGDAEERMRRALANARARSRLNLALGGLLILTLAALAALSVRGRDSARANSERTQHEASHVESLDMAAQSSAAPDTLTRLAQAKLALELEDNASSESALRSAIEAFSRGVDLKIPVLGGPSDVAVSDDGKHVAVTYSDGSLSLTEVGASSIHQRLIPGHDVHFSPRIAFSPDGMSLAALTQDDAVTHHRHRKWDPPHGRRDEWFGRSRLHLFGCRPRLPARREHRVLRTLRWRRAQRRSDRQGPRRQYPGRNNHFGGTRRCPRRRDSPGRWDGVC